MREIEATSQSNTVRSGEAVMSWRPSAEKNAQRMGTLCRCSTPCSRAATGTSLSTRRSHTRPQCIRRDAPPAAHERPQRGGKERQRVVLLRAGWLQVGDAAAQEHRAWRRNSAQPVRHTSKRVRASRAASHLEGAALGIPQARVAVLPTRREHGTRRGAGHAVDLAVVVGRWLQGCRGRRGSP